MSLVASGSGDKNPDKLKIPTDVDFKGEELFTLEEALKMIFGDNFSLSSLPEKIKGKMHSKFRSEGKKFWNSTLNVTKKKSSSLPKKKALEVAKTIWSKHMATEQRRLQAELNLLISRNVIVENFEEDLMEEDEDDEE
jgi:hypothetical protein